MTMHPALLNESRFEEREPHERGFAEYFDARLRSPLMPFEDERLAVRRKTDARKLVIVAVIVAAAVLAYRYPALLANLFDESNGRGNGAGIVLLLCIFGPLVWLRRASGDYADRLRQTVFPLLLRFFGDFAPMPDEQIPGDDAVRSRIVRLGASTAQTGGASGTLDGRAVRMWNIYSSSESGRHAVVHFDGQLIVVTAPKRKIAHAAFVLARAQLHTADTQRMTLAGLHEVSALPPAFVERFAVFAEFESEARELLTAETCERLTRFATMPDTATVQFSWIGGTLYIARKSAPPLYVPYGPERSPYDDRDFRNFLRKFATSAELVRGVDPA